MESKTKGSANVKDYLLDNNETPWFTVGVSVMATQASAITFYQHQDKPIMTEWDLYNSILDCL